MYKEVNRSLIKWPVAASASILAMLWFPMDSDLDEAEQHGSQSVTLSPSRAAVSVKEVISILPETAGILHGDKTEAEVAGQVAGQVAQAERRAVVTELPPQVAKALAVSRNEKVAAETPRVEGQAELPVQVVAKAIIKAPVRMVEQELAGLDLADRDDSLNPSLSSPKQQAGNFDSPAPTTASASELVILEQCERIDWGSPIWMVRPWSPSDVRTGSHLSRLIGPNPESMLPQSNHVLGRRDLRRSDLQESVPGLSWAGVSQAVRHHLRVVTNRCDDWFVMLALQSERLKEFVVEHKLELGGETRVQDAGTVQDPVEAATVVPVAGVISVEGEIAVPQIKQSVSREVTTVRIASSDQTSDWPEAKQLVTQLKRLADLKDDSGPQQEFRFISADGTEMTIAGWAARVQGLLADLQELPRLGDAGAGAIIDALIALAAEGREQAEELEDRQRQVQWLRAIYAISRRTAVWMPVWDLSRSDDLSWDLVDVDLDEPLESAVQQVRDDLVVTGDVAGWNAFLMLDEVLEQGQGGNPATRAILSQRLMSRLEWHNLGAEQSQWLKRESIEQLVAVIRPWAQRAVDYAALMNQLEQQESNAIDLAAVDIASAVQTLRFAKSPAAVKVSAQINTHYRNANVRFAISERFIELMIPAIEPTSVSVNTQVLGARVSGVSQIQSDLDIDLEPSSDRWLLKLNANGRVETDSIGKQGFVSVRTAASAKFDAATHIEVTKRGMSLGGADAQVRSKTRLRGVETDYDGWPLVGTLVRSIAEDRYREMVPQANRIANREAQIRIESEIDSQLGSRVDQAAVKVSEMVLGPLGRLQLDPQVTDMQTTDERLLARYRVAGDWQLGAFTPRPRALSDSLMSVQLHQSALNNTLEQLISSKEPISIRDLIRDSAARFGKADVGIPDDIPDDVMVQFARTRPITVEIEDGRLWLTLRVLRLRRDEGIDLTQFIVRVGYRPEMDGMNARLVRDGHLRISGPRMAMRERLPVRAIFNKVFAANREIPLTVPQLTENPATAGLFVSQLELRDGWLAMAISEEGAARIALRQE